MQFILLQRLLTATKTIDREYWLLACIYLLIFPLYGPHLSNTVLATRTGMAQGGGSRGAVANSSEHKPLIMKKIYAYGGIFKAKLCHINLKDHLFCLTALFVKGPSPFFR